MNIEKVNMCTFPVEPYQQQNTINYTISI